MTDYHGNTNKAKEEGKKEEKKIERITSSEVVIKKKGPWRTFKDLVIEADMGSVGRFIWLDLFIPMVKNMIVDTVDQGVKRAVYGDRRAAYRPPSSSLTGQQRITYNSPVSRPYTPYSSPSPRSQEIAPRPSHNSRSYIITAKNEAELVLEMIGNIIDRYGVVTVADLHEMLGIEHNYIDNNWGWRDVRNAQIRQIREGWVLELPEIEPLQN